MGAGMDELLHYYERELGTLHAHNQAFARRYPAIAGALGIVGGDLAPPTIRTWRACCRRLPCSMRARPSGWPMASAASVKPCWKSIFPIICARFLPAPLPASITTRAQ